MAPADPFALPPPGTARLRLLFLVVVAGSFFAGYWFLVLMRDGWRERNQACGQTGQVPDFLDCSTRVLVLQSLAPLAGLALVAMLTLWLALFAVACFVLVAAVPMCLSALLATGTTPALALTWRTAIVGLLVIGTFAAVSRAREHDADLRAGQFRPDDVVEFLSRGREEKPYPVRLHPPIHRRLQVLRDPGLVMRASAAEALTGGVAAGVVITELGVILQNLLPMPAIAAYWIAGLIIAAPLIQVVGLGIWRQVLAHPVRPALGRTVLRIGLALGAGLAVGAVLAPRASVEWRRWLTAAPDTIAPRRGFHLAPRSGSSRRCS